MDQKAKQVVARVAVVPFRPGPRLQRLRQIRTGKLVLGIFAVEVDDAFRSVGVVRTVEYVRYARGVRKQLSNRDRFLGRRRLGQILVPEAC